MRLSVLDGVIMAAYFALSALVGVWFAKRAGKSGRDFFTAGRSLPWWLAGTSMVATTFAADTPLAVTGLVAAHGVAGNWVWWNMVAGGLLTVFFYARLWHRADVQTDAELTELRYSGKPAAILRGFRAVYLALPVNLIIMGWVNLAMVKILAVTLQLDPFAAMSVLLAITATYALLSGLWGVVVTDLVQFVTAMAGSIVLAFYAVHAAGGLDTLVARAAEHFGSSQAAVGLWPSDRAWMPLSTLLTYLAVQWWASWYPGAEPGGGGYVAQRIFSAKSERDGVLATLWFNVAHYAVRPWPWILTALACVVLYPGLADPATGYVRAAVDLLPPGARGLFLAAFAAAYMSTVSTQLNWGASYLAGDLYTRFVRPNATPRQVVRVSRAATALLMLLSLAVTWWLMRGSVEAAWRLLIALGAGTGPVYLLRWFWWRINAWSEISAMLASLVSFALLSLGGFFDPGDANDAAKLMLASTLITSVIWVVVTYLTKPVDEPTLVAFYRRVRPGGPGWRAVTGRAGIALDPLAGDAFAWLRFVFAMVAVYGALFGAGMLLLGPRGWGLVALGAGALGFVLLARTKSFQERGAARHP